MVDHRIEGNSTDHWTWRYQMAQLIASHLDADRFGVTAMYVIGSTKNATAGPKSDIDLLVHFHGTERQKEQLSFWLEGWSLCLDEVNFVRTGQRTGGLLDVHFITDRDIAMKSSYAVKINSPSDPARRLLLKNITPSAGSGGE
jgi:pyruvate,water dikinase